MQRFFQIVQEHPLWILGGVLVGVILITWFWSGSSSGSSTSSAPQTLTVDPNVIAANTALTLAQDQMSTYGQAIAAQVAMKQDENATMISLAQMGQHQNEQANTFSFELGKQSIAAQKDISTITLANQAQANVLQTGTNLAAITAAYNVAETTALNPPATANYGGSYATGPTSLFMTGWGATGWERLPPGASSTGTSDFPALPALNTGSFGAAVQALLNPAGETGV